MKNKFGETDIYYNDNVDGVWDYFLLFILFLMVWWFFLRID